MSQYEAKEKRKSSAGRKVLAAFGIFFITIGISLATFAFSLRVLMLPSDDEEKRNIENEAERLRIENTQLEEENRRLQEENDILKGGSGSTASSTSSSSGN